jgi:hypothetical protein
MLGSSSGDSDGTDGVARLFRELDFEADMHRARDDTILRRIGRIAQSAQTRGERDDSDMGSRRLSRLAFIQERLGVEAYHRYAASGDAEVAARASSFFRLAYDAWRALATLPSAVDGSTAEEAAASIPSTRGLAVLQETLPERPLSSVVALALHMAVTGTAGNRQAEIRLDLESFDLLSVGSDRDSWLEGSRASPTA